MCYKPFRCLGFIRFGIQNPVILIKSLNCQINGCLKAIYFVRKDTKWVLYKIWTAFKYPSRSPPRQLYWVTEPPPIECPPSRLGSDRASLTAKFTKTDRGYLWQNRSKCDRGWFHCPSTSCHPQGWTTSSPKDSTSWHWDYCCGRYGSSQANCYEAFGYRDGEAI